MSLRSFAFFWMFAGAVHPFLLPAQTLPTLSLTPATLNFTHQIGAAQLPAAQTIQVKRSGSGAALDFAVTVQPAAPWLIVTPLAGRTGSAISLRVNPTSLIAGAYSTTVQVESPSAAAPVTAVVNLTIRNPPPTMSAAPATLSFNWRTDDAGPPPAQSVAVSTTGEPFSISVAASGGAWLTVTPAVGVVLAGSPLQIAVSVNTAGMSPGSYPGRIAITSATASNKAINIAVTLTVTPGVAVLSSIWPNAAPIGSGDATVTIRGLHLFRQSVVRAQTTDLTAVWISSDAVMAVIPRELLTAEAALSITVRNPEQVASNALTFHVTPPGPRIQTVRNAASFVDAGATPAIAPGEILSIFGSGLGPDAMAQTTPVNGVFPTSFGNPAVTVEFELSAGVWTAAPLLAIHANQINCQAPFGMPAAPGLQMRVTYNAVTSEPFVFDGVEANPGVFTVDSSGRGQAAALNYQEDAQTYSLNSGANPAPRGGILILYFTGGGAISPAPTSQGEVAPVSPLPAVVAAVSATVGGVAFPVLSATAVPGALGGLSQLNLAIPSTSRAGKDLPVILTIAGRTSPVSATVAIK